MNKETFPYLVVEKRNNDYAYINLSDLDLFSNIIYNDLRSLDTLLQMYTEKEIKDSIIRANIVADADIADKNLFVLINGKKKPVVTRNVVGDLNIIDFIYDNYEDKRFKNVIYNKLAAILKDEEKSNIFKNVIDNDSFDIFYKYLSSMDYSDLREFYLYLYNDVVKKIKVRDNKLKREKVND